ncbi:MAG: hypothetical protein ACYCYF_02125 [Anaerolineae bacterium]
MVMQIEGKRALLEELWRSRIHTDPQAMERAPEPVRQIVSSLWEPAERIRARLAQLPEGLLSLWIESQRGHLVVTHRPSHYAAGIQQWRGRELDGVCYLTATDVLLHPYAAFAAIGDLLDHLLGSRGDSDGVWFADGEGATPELSQLAERFASLNNLGYATPEGGADSPRSYFGHTWALYMTDPGELNTLDPLAYRLYRHALMSQDWWKRAGQSSKQA